MEIVAAYGGGADVAWKMGRIMLKYRPIAPKPVTGEAVAVGSIDMKSNGGRGKRKGGVNQGRRGRKRAKKEAGVPLAGEVKKIHADDPNHNTNNIFWSPTEVVTLPLMPETPERKEASPVGTPSPTESDGHVTNSFFGCAAAWEKTPTCPVHDFIEARSNSVMPRKIPESCHNNCTSVSALSERIVSGTQNNDDNSSSFLERATDGNDDRSNDSSGAHVIVPGLVRPVGSWVTVECVTSTWHGGEVPLAALEYDTCPSFVSDGRDRVTWMNEACKKMMVGPGGSGDEGEVRVSLETRGTVPRDGCACLTCMARVKHLRRGRGKVSMVVPCDVWRLGGGRLAWRMDVKAALSLGLGCLM